MQGWGSNDPVFQMVIAALRPRIIVEVGTWKGASAIHMGQLVRALGLDARIVCVDTWLGSPEHFLGLEASWRESLRFRNGFPQLYFTFLTNVVQHGMTDLIVPLPATSENAAGILSHKGIRPDLVYIDGTHQYAAVKRDLQMYWQLLSDDGVLLGDDYLAWPGVTQAANEFANENNLLLAGRHGKFLLAKRREFLPNVVPSLQQ